MPVSGQLICLLGQLICLLGQAHWPIGFWSLLRSVMQGPISAAFGPDRGCHPFYWLTINPKSGPIFLTQAPKGRPWLEPDPGLA